MLGNVRFTDATLRNMKKQFVSIPIPVHIFCRQHLNVQVFSAFIKCHLFIRHGVQSQLCSATRAPNLSFKYAKCFIMYSAAEIIIQQSCPNKAKATSCLIIQFSRVQSETCSYALCNIMPTIIFTATDGISKQGAQLLLG